MIGVAILQPVVVLAAWTMVMWFWLYGSRLPAMTAQKIDPEELSTITSSELNAMLPPQVAWKAHNYNHLHEAPTVFYAVAIVLAIVGAGDGLNAQMAWVYVGLRILHSLVQSTINRVMIRFLLFAASSFCLMFLVFRAAMVVL